MGFRLNRCWYALKLLIGIFHTRKFSFSIFHAWMVNRHCVTFMYLPCNSEGCMRVLKFSWKNEVYTCRTVKFSLCWEDKCISLIIIIFKWAMQMSAQKYSLFFYSWLLTYFTESMVEFRGERNLAPNSVKQKLVRTCSKMKFTFVFAIWIQKLLHKVYYYKFQETEKNTSITAVFELFIGSSWFQFTIILLFLLFFPSLCSLDY